MRILWRIAHAEDRSIASVVRAAIKRERQARRDESEVRVG